MSQANQCEERLLLGKACALTRVGDARRIPVGRPTGASLLFALALFALGCDRDGTLQTQAPQAASVPTAVQSNVMKDEERRGQGPRDQMMGQIAEGVSVAKPGDYSTKSILARGCDPHMALRASEMLPPHLGNPQLVSVTNDDDFIEKLRSKKWSIVFFAPGACRYNAANRPIPGASVRTRGWSLAQYRELVRQLQGEGVQIVETTDERKIIPLLRRALAESRDGTAAAGARM